ncbi:hypothetical protein T10_4169 [Trichinella papuae]|uniref:Uncharacterized protein n=1 Tax=Trichinella papuae TaxID=268474 RepID=A0A0V1MSI7_9BILA|nr:hypothetical protein T10_4169 [Trichinella papuae]
MDMDRLENAQNQSTYSIQLQRNFELLSFLKTIQLHYVYSCFIILKKRPKLRLKFVSRMRKSTAVISMSAKRYIEKPVSLTEKHDIEHMKKQKEK